MTAYLFCIAEPDTDGNLTFRDVTIHEAAEWALAQVSKWENSPEFLAGVDAEYDAAFGALEGKKP